VAKRPSRSSAPPPEPHIDDAAGRRIAEQLNHHFPDWLVLWGPWSKEWWAFARFAAPRGTILHSADANELTRHMQMIMASAPRLNERGI
jgi:hypothetical protein